jgi:hypothetical protein
MKISLAARQSLGLFREPFCPHALINKDRDQFTGGEGGLVLKEMGMQIFDVLPIDL